MSQLYLGTRSFGFGSSYLSKWQLAAGLALSVLLWCAPWCGVAPVQAAEPDSQWTTLTDNGLSAYRRNDLINAEKLLSKALLKSHEFQGVDVRRLRSMNNLAMVFVAQKRYSEALAVFDSVVRMSERAVPPKVVPTSATAESVFALNQAVKLHKSLGNVKLAQAAEAKLVKLSKTIPVPDVRAASSATKP